MEPRDLWTERMDPIWGDRIPRLVRKDGIDKWVVDNIPISPVTVYSQAGIRFETPELLTYEGEFEDVWEGGYDPHAHVKDMESDGVWGGILYPSLGFNMYAVPDHKLLEAAFAAYNDWLAEFCEPYPDRLKGVANVMVDDVDAGIKELERAKKMGLCGAMIGTYPLPDLTYDHPRYEPFWEAAQDLGMVLSFHIGSNRPGSFKIQDADGNITVRAADITNADYWARMSLCDVVYSGVFERYPNLNLVCVEHELGWIPFLIERMDYRYKYYYKLVPNRFKGSAVPSDFMRKNVFYSFQEDQLGIRLRDLIGIDQLMWGSDYPHPESTFPKSQEILGKILDGVPEDEKEKIVGGNASRLYNFS